MYFLVQLLKNTDWFFFYSFYLFAEVLTEFIHSTPECCNHLYNTITLNSLSGKFLISVSFSSFSEVLSYSFIWKVFLCLLILLYFLRLFLYIIYISYVSQS